MNFESNLTKPMLVEPGTKYFLNEMLKQCHVFRKKYENTILNIALFLAFVLVLAILLIYKYKGKMTEEEMYQKDFEKQQYILSKIKNYQDVKLRTQQSLITGLPHWESEFDIIHKKINI